MEQNCCSLLMIYVPSWRHFRQLSHWFGDYPLLIRPAPQHAASMVQLVDLDEILKATRRIRKRSKCTCTVKKEEHFFGMNWGSLRCLSPQYEATRMPALAHGVDERTASHAFNPLLMAFGVPPGQKGLEGSPGPDAVGRIPAPASPV